MMSLLVQIPYAIMVTCGFCVIFNVPARKFPLCIIVGAASWMSYRSFSYIGLSVIFAAFLAACIVWLLSNIFARIFKETSTVFIIPGILCLVPGSGMYHSMLYLLQHDAAFSSTATETLFIAGAIAAGLLAMGSVMSVIIRFINRIRSLAAKNQS